MDELNIEANRAARKYPLRIQFLRMAWSVGRILFRMVPRPFYAPRRVLLRCFGAKVGRNVNVANSATIYFPWNLEIGDWSAIGEGAMVYNLGMISIGEKATVSQGAHLCAGTHDFSDPATPLLTPAIKIGSQAWICADAFVGPGVEVGAGAVIGARAVAVKDIEPWTVVAGNPAKFVKKREMKGVA
ncbi:Virginiamycin A acetyltransferase [Pontiella desulfatans]|uniref:Virginiamycin A acetyltransferase n=1 Tax=Pontiella desulfatans TaxID=2750659 RepID=A0A6C2U4K3_PONDE|nr:putative colanic acid biosynthesis acetyltransferase [Pontiella desulfatans]VGO14813.1 Virginiamycin A acetyltransferase [Pontiella desulfatans]